jgi:hypothetical protein
MNYIDVDKVILENNQELNELLICLICQGIVIYPEECSSCQRPYCTNCINRMEKKECAQCKTLTFNQAHIQTRRLLNELKFKTECCDTIIKYSDIPKHITECGEYTKCILCNKYYSKVDYEHSPLCKLTEQLNNNDMSKNTILPLQNNFFQVINNDNSQIIQNPSKLCNICNTKDYVRKCKKCSHHICESCTYYPNVIDIFRINENYEIPLAYRNIHVLKYSKFN